MDSAMMEHTHGFRRRFLIIPFNQKIAADKIDRDLHSKILANPAGVLNWIIEGAKAVVKNRDIFVSKECEDCKRQFVKETDTVAMFEEQFIIENLGQFKKYMRTVSESYNEYKAFCGEVGYRNPLGRTNFVKRMELLGFEKSKKEQGITLEKDY